MTAPTGSPSESAVWRDYDDDLVCPKDERSLLDGGRHGDVLVGSARGAVLRGGSGPDRISGGGNGFTITAYGDEGDDVIHGTGLDPTVYYGPDTLYGGPGNDYLDGEQGDDRLYGNAGNDRLYGDTGRDTAYGSTGSDLCRAEVRRGCER